MHSGEPIVETLATTGTVLGLFKQWDSEIAEIYLRPGDTLAIYTDGVTETTDENQVEFGENGLIAALAAQRGLPAPPLLNAVLGSLERFRRGAQADDITLIIARARP